MPSKSTNADKSIPDSSKVYLPEGISEDLSGWKQKAAVTLFGTGVVFLPLIYIILFVLFPLLSVPLLLYAVFCLTDPAPENGIGRAAKCIHSFQLWDYIVAYFSPQIVCEYPVDPARKFIMCVHPHGILSFGPQMVLGSKKVGLDRAFPGLTFHPAVLPVALKTPFFREYLLALGCISSSRQSIRKCLARGNGHTPGIVVGGAQESLIGDSTITTLVLKNRKGFVREALMAGADLLPVFVFNENRIYKQLDNPPGSLLHRIQAWFKSITNFGLPVFYGVWGFVPFRVPITFVCGKPVRVEQKDCPTKEDIDRYHALYVGALTDLWNRNHDKYEPGTKELKFI